MARKPRIEVEGGLYHLITRGVDRRDIFHSPEDFQKFIAILSSQKTKLPFYLYAYCLMTNHVHLLIERMTDDVGRIMHRVLTGYTQYYNRKYRRTGHLLQGRHKAILCQSDPYLAELVRYIHLNPVRAKMAKRPEEYLYSSHRTYIGAEPAGAVDVEPVLRRFAAKKSTARERYVQFVHAGVKLGHQEQFYAPDNGILGNDEFVDQMIHRIGEFDARAASVRRKTEHAPVGSFDSARLVRAVETVCGIARDEFVGPGKRARQMFAKEVMLLAGREFGAGVTTLSIAAGVSVASTSRRLDAALRKMGEDGELRSARDRVVEEYKTAGRES